MCCVHIISCMFGYLCLQREQPLGTPGKEASWGGLPVWPGAEAFEKLAADKARSGLVVNFIAAQEWFLPRFTAWKAGNAPAITADDVVEFFSGDAAWNPAGPSNN
jgi:hypothetical protein